MLLLFDCIRLNDVLRLAWPSEKSFTVLNIYSMNKDYAELENSKQKNSKQKKNPWVIIKISVPVFDLESSDLSAQTCSGDLHFLPKCSFGDIYCTYSRLR